MPTRINKSSKTPILYFILVTFICLVFAFKYAFDNNYTLNRKSNLSMQDGYILVIDDISTLDKTYAVSSMRLYNGLLKPNEIQETSSFEIVKYSRALKMTNKEGTYRFVIENKTNAPFTFSLYFPQIMTQSDIYINGNLISSTTDKTINKSISSNIITYNITDKADIVINVVNHSCHYFGFTSAPIFASPDKINNVYALKQMHRVTNICLLAFVTILGISLCFIEVKRSYMLLTSTTILGVLFNASSFMGLRINQALVWSYLYDIFIISYTLILYWYYMIDIKQKSKPVRIISYSLIAVLGLLLIVDLIVLNAMPSIYFIFSSVKFLIILLIMVWAFIVNGYSKQFIFKDTCYAIPFCIGIIFQFFLGNFYSPIYTLGTLDEGLLISQGVLGCVFVYDFCLIIKQARLANQNLKNQVDIKTQHISDIMEERKQLLTSIVHDLKAPLSSIQLSVDRMSEQNDEYAKSISNEINTIEAKIENINSKLHELQSYSSFDVVHEESIVFDLREVLIQLSEYFESDANGNGVYFESKFSKHPLLINGQKDKITRSLENIIFNALEHTYEGNHIHFTNTVRNNRVVIKIKNDGEPIEKENLKNIFNKNFTTSNCTDRGLGLYFTKLIIEENDGKIDVETDKNENTIFVIELPLCE